MTFVRTVDTKVAKVSVWDDDPMTNDLLGLAEINIPELCGNQECENVVTLPLKKDDGEENGSIVVKVVFSFTGAWEGEETLYNALNM